MIESTNALVRNLLTTAAFVTTPAIAQAQLTPAQRDSILRADSLFWTAYRLTIADSTDFDARPYDPVIVDTWLAAPVLFSAKASNVDADALEVLRVKGALLRDNPGSTVTIIGHADTAGSATTNQQLAWARAQEARRLLIANGVREGQITIDYASAGEIFDADATLNRRVDFDVSLAGTARLSDRTIEKVNAAGLPAVISAPAAADFTPVEVLYATDRGYSAESNAFNATRLDSLVFGKAIVTVPRRHVRGQQELPGAFAWGASRQDKDKFFVVDEIRNYMRQDWESVLTSEIDQAPRQEVFLYIHGYNVDFRQALMTAAQATVDLQLRSVPVAFSWPSFGELLKYGGDYDASEVSAKKLAQLIEQIAARVGARKVHLLAHSMGARATLRAAQELAQSDRTILGQVILAAPDEDRHSGITALPQLVSIASHVTLYASARDKALIAAQKLRGGLPRLGQAGQHLTIADRVETIDVSNIPTDFLAHSYYANSPYVLDDLRLLLNIGSAAADRLTIRRSLNGKDYWTLAPRRGH